MPSVLKIRTENDINHENGRKKMYSCENENILINFGGI